MHTGQQGSQCKKPQSKSACIELRTGTFYANTVHAEWWLDDILMLIKNLTVILVRFGN